MLEVPLVKTARLSIMSNAITKAVGFRYEFIQPKKQTDRHLYFVYLTKNYQ